MVRVSRRTEVIEGIDPKSIPYDDLIAANKPFVLKGGAADWPLVAKGLQSADAAIDYILGFDAGRPIVGYTGHPGSEGVYFYNDDLSGFNFDAGRYQLADYMQRIRTDMNNPDAPSYYIGSTDVDMFLPGFRAENDLTLNASTFDANPPLVSMWLGTRTTASAHFDMSNNMACCLVGRRRFTLFAPDQIANLYPGPLEPTPGGQVVSMVDFRQPDYDRYPNFRNAEAVAEVAELEPGDILIYPAMWWHHVEALDDFNVMVNYWWNVAAGHMDTPMNTVLHALLSLRDRPMAEKEAWKNVFEYYIFGPSDRAGAHLPAAAAGPLGPMDPMTARRLRANLLQRLNR
ncbi:cupin-like domain-containing protein [Parvularcula sp. LCG005]|uniref:cupin-like domain-containing protein n=1 Tax=Parvularcula sp. LCG005 TaxID=3078805 RepID=UPI0029420190|nr:cupin-like domain-containing protein [Parvularcula sp. LCG005]WOI52668.1 cupin-like domain-containing protein [Parvularcula sp. LCG005]